MFSIKHPKKTKKSKPNFAPNDNISTGNWSFSKVADFFLKVFAWHFLWSSLFMLLRGIIPFLECETLY